MYYRVSLLLLLTLPYFLLAAVGKELWLSSLLNVFIYMNTLAYTNILIQGEQRKFTRSNDHPRCLLSKYNRKTNAVPPPKTSFEQRQIFEADWWNEF